MAKTNTSKEDPDCDSLSIPEKIAQGRKYIEFLKDNPEFQNPDEPVELLKATIDKLERIYNEAELAARIVAVKERKLRESQERFLKALDESPITWH